MSFARILRITAITLMILTGINAVIAGLLFIISPSGEMMGMTTEYLKHSPFTSFFIPGLVLFTVNGLLNFYSAFLSWRKLPKHAFFITLQGALLMGWIGIQVIMVNDFNMLHLIMGSIGILLTIIGLVLLYKKY